MRNEMIVCPVCGAENDPGNRFCDQCGAQLNVEGAGASAVAGGSPIARLSCAICGAMVLPGQVFCDNCGADLRVNRPVDEMYTEEQVPSDMEETVPVPSTKDPSTFVLPTESHNIVSPADMRETMDASAWPESLRMPSASSDEETLAVPPLPDETLLSADAADGHDMDVPPPVTSLEQQPEPQGEEPENEQTMVAAAIARAQVMGTREFGSAPEEVPTPDVDVPTSAKAVQEERQRLHVEIEHHRKAIAQMEQMMQIYPQGSEPAYLAVALEDARRALTQAEFKLESLPHGPDPAEVKRLEDEIEHHRKTINQMEEMMKGFASGEEPPYLTVAVGDAHRALTQAETDLAALQEGYAASLREAAPVAGEAAPRSVPPASPAAVSQAEDAYMQETLVAAPEELLSPPAVEGISVPRLVLLDGGQELPLPTDKPEIIIGREDPVSNIYPEIDLTPFGGETGGVSRQHARIDHHENQWTITDLNSTNYTRVNGSKLDPNVPMPIEHGSRLQFGRVAVILKL